MPVACSSQPTVLRGWRWMIRIPTTGNSAVIAMKASSPMVVCDPQSVTVVGSSIWISAATTNERT